MKKKKKNLNALKELKNKLPYGDIGRNINSFIFYNHPDTIHWRLNNKNLKINDYPINLVFIPQNKCLICNKSYVDKNIFECLVDFQLTQCGKIEYGISRLGWLYCENCKSRFNNFILPKYYSEMINLSPSCYQSNGKMKIIKYGSTSFGDKTNLLLSENNKNNLRFYRKSSRNPEKNGITNCLLALDCGKIIHFMDKKFFINVLWKEINNDIVHKLIPLENLLFYNKFLWKSPKEFITDFEINKKNFTIKSLNLWYKYIYKTFKHSLEYNPYQ